MHLQHHCHGKEVRCLHASSGDAHRKLLRVRAPGLKRKQPQTHERASLCLPSCPAVQSWPSTQRDANTPETQASSEAQVRQQPSNAYNVHDAVIRCAQQCPNFTLSAGAPACNSLALSSSSFSEQLMDFNCITNTHTF